MSSNAFDSRAPSVNTCGGTGDAHPTKHRYTAVTVTGVVYDVLNTRTSEKNGATGRTNDAATGMVVVSAASGRANSDNKGKAARRTSRGCRRVGLNIAFVSSSGNISHAGGETPRL